ncbi:MAG: glycosyltransferase family 9 protein [Thermodesulfovibrionales bacterium]|nr:glycosyltransferase family 9 protein [Thermodesulfovibrionales bacterium]
MKKAFIYRRGGLGDTLLVFPLLEILKKEGYHNSVSGNRDYLKLGLEAGWIDRIISEPPDGDFDLRIIIGFANEENKGSRIISPFPKKREWIVEYYLRELGLYGIPFSNTLPLNSERLKRKVTPGQEFFRDKIIIHPSSGSKKKNLPASLFLKLIELFPDSVTVAGEADFWISEHLKPFYFDSDILRTAALLRVARLFIGADSGLAHLSAYLGVKTVVIYGPTDPVIWKPVGERLIQLRPSGCKPCFPQVCEDRHCLDDEENIKRLIDFLKKYIRIT